VHGAGGRLVPRKSHVVDDKRRKKKRLELESETFCRISPLAWECPFSFSKNCGHGREKPRGLREKDIGQGRINPKDYGRRGLEPNFYNDQHRARNEIMVEGGGNKETLFTNKAAAGTFSKV